MSSVNTNMGAVVSAANMAKFGREMDTSIERLSSGLRINSAKDDAAGMAIVSKMESQVRGVGQAIRNANDAQKLIDTSEGAHVETLNILQRLRELAVQSSNDTNQALDRTFLNSESTQLIAEIDRIAKDTTWNGAKILDGTFSSKQFQLGANANEKVTYSIDSAKSADIGNYQAVGIAAINDTAANTMAANTLTVSGYVGTASVSVTALDTAGTVAAAINAEASTTGVTATAITKAKLSGLTVAEDVAFTLGNGTSSASISVTITSTSDLRVLKDAINAVAGTTGITAEMSTNAAVILTHSTGEDISISAFDTTTNTTDLVVTALDKNGVDSTTATESYTLDEATLAAVTVSGQISLNSHKTFSIASSVAVVETNHFDDDSGATTSLSAISAINLGTASGAESAIEAIDGAIAKINQSRADLGAISNRLDSTISNLTNVSTNVEGSMSNVRDADFSLETSKLTRAQILTQAATSMLAQANASKQNILALLQG
jgi:flagellin